MIYLALYLWLAGAYQMARAWRALMPNNARKPFWLCYAAALVWPVTFAVVSIANAVDSYQDWRAGP